MAVAVAAPSALRRHASVLGRRSLVRRRVFIACPAARREVGLSGAPDRRRRFAELILGGLVPPATRCPLRSGQASLLASTPGNRGAATVCLQENSTEAGERHVSCLCREDVARLI